MPNLTDVLNNAKEILRRSEVDEREARLLLSFALNKPKEELLCLKEISSEEEKIFKELITKRCSGVPYAYIVGHKEFMKLDFIVNENVLIPREDTEVLVQKAINILSKDKNEKQVLDMCTGSGCIAISVAKNVESVNMYASDISDDAINIAKENAKQNDVEIKFIKSDLFKNINNSIKYDMIISNPPYIETSVISTLNKEVKDNEPMIALDGGEDGLDFYRRISKKAKEHLKEKGYLIFEIGFDQAIDVKNILESEGYTNIEIIKDLSNNDRVVIAQS